jgi:hypothetical protein
MIRLKMMAAINIILLCSLAIPLAEAGSCLQFDGIDDYVNIGNDASLDVGNTLTVEAWVRADDLSSRQGIFSTRINNAPGSFQLEVGTASGGTNCVAVTGVNTLLFYTSFWVIFCLIFFCKAIETSFFVRLDSFFTLI